MGTAKGIPLGRTHIINISVEKASFSGVFRAIRATWFIVAKKSEKKGLC